MSFISCYWRSDSCVWERIDDDFRLNYDIWIVNGNPEATSRDNRFEYHFSFDNHDLVEIYFICVLLYLLIPLPLVVIKLRSLAYAKHPILISYVLFQIFFFVGNTSNLIHYFIFAYNGIGIYLLVHIGNIITIIGESILILLLLFIAKGKTLTCTDRFIRSFLGWLMNTPVLRQGQKTVILFVLYTVACCSCYILSVITTNRVSDSNHYQTFANYFSLLFRCFVMLLFVFELKETTQEEKNVGKLQFFHHFGACCMVSVLSPPGSPDATSRLLGLVRLSHRVDLHHVVRHRTLSIQINHKRCYLSQFPQRSDHFLHSLLAQILRQSAEDRLDEARRSHDDQMSRRQR